MKGISRIMEQKRLSDLNQFIYFKLCHLFCATCMRDFNRHISSSRIFKESFVLVFTLCIVLIGFFSINDIYYNNYNSNQGNYNDNYYGNQEHYYYNLLKESHLPLYFSPSYFAGLHNSEKLSRTIADIATHNGSVAGMPESAIGIEGRSKSIVTSENNSNFPRERIALLNRLREEALEKYKISENYLASKISKVKGGNPSDYETLADLIVSESASIGYDPLFIAAIILAESTFNYHAVSSKGAQGLMQIMPATGIYISEKTDRAWKGLHTLRDPEHNIKLGVTYLKYLEKLFSGNMSHALIAYNWGPGNLKAAIKRNGMLPAGPVKYAKKVLDIHRAWHREMNQIFANQTFAALEQSLTQYRQIHG